MTKNVVITGGQGDIAIAIANEIKEAFNDYNIYLPSKDDLNVTDIKMVKKYFSEIKADILINNAGAICINSIAEDDIAIHKKVIDINLIGTFNCTNAVLRNNSKAKIINIGSSAGTKVHGNWSSYCASKSAVIMATKCWAEEGIDTVCISPGRTHTKMRTSMYPNEDFTTLMTPKDFAKVVVKNIKENSYTKGMNIDVNINNVKELINE